MSTSLLEIANAAIEQVRVKQANHRGITVADVLHVWPGAKIRPKKPVQQGLLPCLRCGGEMRERLGKGRRHVMACMRCGKKAR